MKHRISKLDGTDDSLLKEDVSVQTEDSLLLILAEDCEEEYIGETIRDLPYGFFFDHWYTESVRRAPKDYWLIKQKGKFRN